jgi:diguanylate cyclase
MKLAVHALEKEVTDSQAEITKLRGALLRAQGEALIDPLTGILNRKGFDLRLNALLAHPSGDTGCHCLVMLDIDHFKKVNDTHGHLVGDRVIQAVGEILRTSVTDPKDAAARYGGEEFAILVRQTSLEQCLRLAEQIRERTRSMKLRHRSTQEVLLTVSMSGGIAQMQPGDDAAALISRADAALYRSKAQGRDRLTCA